MPIVRAGRTLETRQALLKSLSAAWARLTGQPERNLILKVDEADPATIMEAGVILPRPGEEGAWFEANKQSLVKCTSPHETSIHQEIQFVCGSTEPANKGHFCAEENAPCLISRSHGH
jgi:hypothetical protein